jgi:tripartite-type tricarboxylate transporter receptor subunit TctC
VTTKQRVAVLPDVPPLAEVGIPDYDASSWHTVAINAHVPADIVEKLSGAIRDIMAEPEIIKVLERDGALPQKSPPPEELKRFVASEIVRWGKVITQAGLAGTE